MTSYSFNKQKTQMNVTATVNTVSYIPKTFAQDMESELKNLFSMPVELPLEQIIVASEKIPAADRGGAKLFDQGISAACRGGFGHSPAGQSRECRGGVAGCPAVMPLLQIVVNLKTTFRAARG